MVEVKLERAGDSLTALLRGEIDHHAAGGLREEIDTAVLQTGAKTLILDFSGISFMDSSGIGLILGRYRMMKGRGGALSVRCASKRQLLVMKMAGLEKLQILQQERTENHETDQ